MIGGGACESIHRYRRLRARE